jgi:hypothetical protein
MQTSAALISLPRIPRGVGLLVVVICGVVLLSSLAGAGAAAFNAPPVWFMLGFEVVIAFATVFGILTGLGRFSDGPALALVCVAGVVGAGSLLGFLAGRGNFSMNLTPMLLAREAAAAGILGAAGILVLMRRPRLAMRRFAIGAACAAAFVGLSGGLWLFGSPLRQLGTVAGAGVGLVLSVVVLGLLATAVHQLIGAFETGALNDDAVLVE